MTIELNLLDIITGIYLGMNSMLILVLFMIDGLWNDRHNKITNICFIAMILFFGTLGVLIAGIGALFER